MRKDVTTHVFRYVFLSKGGYDNEKFSKISAIRIVQKFQLDFSRKVRLNTLIGNVLDCFLCNHDGDPRRHPRCQVFVAHQDVGTRRTLLRRRRDLFGPRSAHDGVELFKQKKIRSQ